MDITPLVSKGGQLIQSYGGGAFSIAGERYTGSVLVFPDRTEPWPVTAFTDVTAETLAAAVAAAAEFEFLIIGAGKDSAHADPMLRAYLRDAGISLEVMDTGAACRTFNVLLAEDRQIAAALIAIE